MAGFREIDSRKMRDRDASSGDRGNGGDMDTLTSGTSVPVGTSGTEGYGDQDTGMGSGYSSGGRMAGSGRTGGGADAGDSGNRDPGDPLPDSGGPDVSDMGENEPNTSYGDDAINGGQRGQATDMGSSGGMMGTGSAGTDSGTSGVDMGAGRVEEAAIALSTWARPQAQVATGAIPAPAPAQ